MSAIPATKKYVSALEDTQKALAEANKAGTPNISRTDGMSIAWRDSKHPILGTVFGPNKKIFIGTGAARAL